ncbi:MAG: hypothetical protein JNM93_07540 [Bacteriovoracaceae bacterium]|nr:hypothetical protein [Bacteriovoracaceae bacterium]
MKKLLLVFIASTSLSAYAENVVITKPFIEVRDKKIGNTTYLSSSETTGSFNMTFKNKEECIDWVYNALDSLKARSKVVFSANCTNDDEFTGEERKDGSYTGSVVYL